MKLKGISPLIAAVLLIAFTMAIAGILAIWATTFSQQRLQSAATCPALGVQDLTYNTATDEISIRLLNTNRNAAQTDIKVSIIYADGTVAEGMTFSADGTIDALGVESYTFINSPLNTAGKPTTNPVPSRAEILTSECPTTPITAIIP